MNKLKKSIITGAAAAWVLLGYGAGIARADDQPAPPSEQPAAPAGPTAMTTPAMTGPLVANPNPASFDLGFLGPVYYNGFISGLGMWQNNVFPGDQRVLASLSNGQFSFQKTDGIFQYYVQVGAYTIPDLGAPYFNVLTTTGDFFGPVPITWLTGSATYTLDPANSFVLAAGGNYSHTTKVTTTTPFFQTTATPLLQNNETLFTLGYTYNSAPWTVTPYFQFTHVPASSSPPISTFSSGSTIGGAILANYSFGDDSPLPGFSLPVRFEYIGSTGSLADGAPNLLYGPGSKAWSITFTPTYQYKIFFARAEISHVGTSSTTPGLVFGPDGNNTTQTRGVLEVGILF